MSPAVSATMSSTVNPSAQASVGGMPRLSKVTTRYPAARSAGTWCRCQERPPAPEPITMTTGSPLPLSS